MSELVALSARDRALGMMRSTSWLVVAQGSALVFGFFVWAYAARILTTESFGQVQLGIAVGTYAALLATVGLSPLSVTEFASQRRPRTFVARVQGIRMAHAVLVVGVLGFAWLVVPHTATAVIVVCAAGVVLRQLWPEWADIALDAPRRVAIVRTTYFTTALVATVVLVRDADDGVRFGLVLALAAVVAGAPAWFLTTRHLREARGSHSDAADESSRWAPMMRRALPLGAGDVLAQLLANADLLILGVLASQTAVAYYGAAYRIVFAVQGAAVALRYASLRVLSTPFASREQQTRFQDDLVLFTLLGSTALASIGALLAPLAVGLAFGAKYAPSSDLLQLLVWTWPLDFAGAIALNFLIVAKRRSAYVAAMGAAAAVNLGANLVVIPLFGASGAALVMVASLLVLLVLAVGAARAMSAAGRRREAVVATLLVLAGVAGSIVLQHVSASAGIAIVALVGVAALARLYTMLVDRRRRRGPDRWLFLIHVDWRWIKQRPHWLSEEALKEHDVLVGFRAHPSRRRLPHNASSVRRFALLPLPLGAALRWPRLSVPALAVQRAWVAMRVSRFGATHVYVSHPKLYPLVPKALRQSAVLVYDCMDDALAMAPPAQRTGVLMHEHAAANEAQLVVASSRALASRLSDRFGDTIARKTVLVQNGTSPIVVTSARSPEPPLTIGYAGTVARWFDFESVLIALDACPEARLRVVGPRTGSEPQHDRIEYVPPVAHEELPQMLGDCDALIMPFKRDEIVTAVNPVKLYEYLAYRVPIIVGRYPEIEDDFESLVFFYDTPADLVSLFRRLRDGELAPPSRTPELEAFLRRASWSSRWTEIEQAAR